MSVQKAEDELIETVITIVGLFVLFLIGAAIYAGWEAAGALSIPYGAYPTTIWGNFATGVDASLSKLPTLFSQPAHNAIDPTLGSVYGWLTDHNLSAPESKLPTSLPGSPANVNIGGIAGNDQSDTSGDTGDNSDLFDDTPVEPDYTNDLEG